MAGDLRHNKRITLFGVVCKPPARDAMYLYVIKANNILNESNQMSKI